MNRDWMKLGNRSLNHFTCIYCGAILIEGTPENEDNHRIDCPERKAITNAKRINDLVDKGLTNYD
jgi:hypothetical protein